MEPLPTLLNPPIAEAVIDLRVDQLENGSPEVFGDLERQVKEMGYPNCERRHVHQRRFEIRGGSGDKKAEATAEDKGFVGLWARSEDESHVVQCRIDGFTMSRLRPYTSWEALRQEARRLWEVYVAALRPERIIRVGVRYINHVGIPATGDLEKYLTCPPPAPPGFPQPLTSYLSRVSGRDADSSRRVHLVQGLQPGEEPNTATILIDIDAFLPVDLIPTSDEAWGALEGLRDLKNKVFFSTVSRELIEELG